MSFGLGFWAAAGGPSQFDYELIATSFGTGSATSVFFDNIPQIYKHLQLRAVTRTAVGAQTDTIFAYNFNNNTNNTNSATHRLYGSGGSIFSSASTGNYSSILGFTPGSSATADAYGAVILDVLDYTSTTKNKTLRSFYGMTGPTNPEVGLHSNLPVSVLGTNAITSMQILFNGNITSPSRFSIYGIRG
jgi:hypothetical protein